MIEDPMPPPPAPAAAPRPMSSNSSSDSGSKRLFVFGLGYSAARAARAFHRRGFAIVGTTRTPAGAEELIATAPRCFTASNVLVFDAAAPTEAAINAVRGALVGVTHVLVSIPPSRPTNTSNESETVEALETDPVLGALGGATAFLEIVRPTLLWLGYLSTIGVYGETHGRAVDETAPVQSAVPRSRWRIAAERQWLAMPLPVHVFRLAGIYGPGRGTIPKVRSGTATRIDLPGRRFNRIHVEDIIQILVASATRPESPNAIYNVADDEPAPAEAVTAFACELLGLPVIPLQTWEEAEKTMSAMARSFYAESKVVTNTRVKEQLGLTLLYPTYREGFLAQILEEDEAAAASGDGGYGHGDDDDDDGSAHKQLQQDERTLVVLANIGSLRPEPYLDLRQIGFRLSRALRRPVVPCSFRFSNRIDPTLLHNQPAKTWEQVVTEFLEQRPRKVKEQASSSPRVVILPLFFGNSTTLTDFLPKVLHKVWDARLESINSSKAPVALDVHVGRCLVDLSDPADNRVARVLHERVQTVLATIPADEDVHVLVLEHGTPNREVHDATMLVTKQLGEILASADNVRRVANACMERRDGSEFDFNDPLLSNAVEHYGIRSGVVIVALLFFSQGRHAGGQGDIEEIVEDVQARHRHLAIRVTEPLGTHSLLSEVLHDRYRQVAKASPTYHLH